MIGLGVYDELILDTIDPETGEVYPAMTCRNDEVMASRCQVDNALSVIWSIKASAKFNNDAALALRGAFKTKRIRLLEHELDAEDTLAQLPGWKNMSAEEKLKYQMPYIQTTLLVNELVSLQSDLSGQNLKLTEQRMGRKDRFSSLMYNNWVMVQLEMEELRSQNTTESADNFAERMRAATFGPTMY